MLKFVPTKSLIILVVCILSLALCFGCTTTLVSNQADGDIIADGDLPLFSDGDLDSVDIVDDSEFADTTDESDTEEQLPDLCGVGDDEKRVRPDYKIYGGTEYPALFSMTPAQQLALGALVSPSGYGSWSNFCTATLIAPHVVLTAAHCMDSISYANQFSFAVGIDAASPVKVFEIEKYYVNPQYSQFSLTPAAHDNTLLILKKSVYDELEDIEPIPINSTPLTSSLLGKRVQNGGYGGTEYNSYNSKRLWVDEVVSSVGNGEFTVNGNGVGSVCFGDSGGPSIYDFGQGIKVIGTVSWGDESCVDTDHFADIANDLSWALPIINGAASGCGLIDNAGKCNGSTAIWCEQDTNLVQENCQQQNKICGLDQNNKNRCIADPCNGITFEGVCQNDVASWCEDGEIKQRRCLPCDQVCGFVGAALGYYCKDAASPVDGDEDTGTASCGSITYLGCCQGPIAVWCDDNTGGLEQKDCGNQSCGWVDSETGYYCGGSGSDPSGTYPSECDL